MHLRAFVRSRIAGIIEKKGVKKEKERGKRKKCRSIGKIESQYGLYPATIRLDDEH